MRRGDLDERLPTGDLDLRPAGDLDLRPTGDRDLRLIGDRLPPDLDLRLRLIGLRLTGLRL